MSARRRAKLKYLEAATDSNDESENAVLCRCPVCGRDYGTGEHCSHLITDWCFTLDVDAGQVRGFWASDSGDRLLAEFELAVEELNEALDDVGRKARNAVLRALPSHLKVQGGPADVSQVLNAYIAAAPGYLGTHSVESESMAGDAWDVHWAIDGASAAVHVAQLLAADLTILKAADLIDSADHNRCPICRADPFSEACPHLAAAISTEADYVSLLPLAIGGACDPHIADGVYEQFVRLVRELHLSRRALEVAQRFSASGGSALFELVRETKKQLKRLRFEEQVDSEDDLPVFEDNRVPQMIFRQYLDALFTSSGEHLGKCEVSFFDDADHGDSITAYWAKDAKSAADAAAARLQSDEILLESLLKSCAEVGKGDHSRVNDADRLDGHPPASLGAAAVDEAPAGYFKPGHDVHWIQWKKAMSEPESWEAASLVKVAGKQIVVQHQDGRLSKFYTDRADEITTMSSARHIGHLAVELSRKWCLLAIPLPGGEKKLFNLREDDGQDAQRQQN